MRNRTQPCSNMKNVLCCRCILLGEICLKTNYLLSVVDKCIYSVLFQPLYQVTIDQMLLFLLSQLTKSFVSSLVPFACHQGKNYD